MAADIEEALSALSFAVGEFNAGGSGDELAGKVTDLVTGMREREDPVQKQAQRYMEAVYGPGVWFRAPETFGNVLIRWIYAVASSMPLEAEKCMAKIEEMASHV